MGMVRPERLSLSGHCLRILPWRAFLWAVALLISILSSPGVRSLMERKCRGALSVCFPGLRVVNERVRARLAGGIEGGIFADGVVGSAAQAWR